jgi:hypothetical protein
LEPFRRFSLLNKDRPHTMVKRSYYYTKKARCSFEQRAFRRQYK